MPQYLALRHHWGIGADEADHGLPAWEVDMLLAAVEARQSLEHGDPEDGGAGVEPVRSDPFAAVPDHLKDL